jgi:predicted MFS family arabinose efflux permease
VIADRYNRKHVLILTDLTRAAVVAGFLLVREPSQIWLLYLLTGIQLAFSGIFFPTHNALLPDIVSEREIGAANALASATWSTMLALGSALGGLVTGLIGIYPAFLIDVLTFLVSAMFIARMEYRSPPPLEDEDKGVASVRRQFSEGVDYLKGHPDIFAISLHKAALSFAVYGLFNVIMVDIARNVFVIGEEGAISLGLQFAVGGLGTGFGPIIARRFTGDNPISLRVALGVSYIIAAIGLSIVAPLSSFPLVLFGMFLLDFGGGINWVFSTQLLMVLALERVRGRVFSIEFAFFTLASAIGAGIGGLILDKIALDLSAIIKWMAILALGPFGLWSLWHLVRNKVITQPSSG